MTPGAPIISGARRPTDGDLRVPSEECWAIVPVYRSPQSGRGTDVSCRALVLHPTKYNRDLLAASPKPRVKMTIDMLPLENVKHIFHFLDARSLVRSEMVCPAWRDASRDDTYWSELCKKEYNVCPKNFRPPPDPVKLLFMLTYGQLSMIKYGRPPELRAF